MKYEKIITINESVVVDGYFSVIRDSVQTLLFFIQDKCKNDKENLEFFQCNLTDSEKCPFSKDLKIKWAVTKH